MSKRTPILRPLFLAILLALGGGIVVGMVVHWCASAIALRINTRTPSASLAIKRDGTPVLIRLSGLGSERAYWTLDGARVPSARIQELNSGVTLYGPETRTRHREPLDWNRRVIAFNDLASPPTYWYFVHDGKPDGRGYFVAFDSVSNLRLGHLGSGGFSAELPPRGEWFPVAGWQMASGAAFATSTYGFAASAYGDASLRGYEAWFSFAYRVPFVSDGQLLEVDLRARTTRVLFEATEIFSEARSLRAQPRSQTKAEDKEPSFDLAVRLADRVRVLDRKTGKHRDYVFPPEVGGCDFTFFELQGGVALIELPPWGDARTLLRIDTAGKILKRWDVSLGTPRRPGPRIEDWAIAIFVPCPLAEIFPVFISPTQGGPFHGVAAAHLPYWQRLAVIFTQYWFWFALVALLAAVFAGLTYRRQRRFAAAWTWVWVPLVFLLGLPGFLGYLCHRPWPVRDACPACGWVVPRDRAACSHCGTEFPAPALKGIEVFAYEGLTDA